MCIKKVNDLKLLLKLFFFNSKNRSARGTQVLMMGLENMTAPKEKLVQHH